MKPLVTNAANEEQLTEAKDKLRFAKDKHLNDWRFLMSTDQGFRTLTHLMRWCKTESAPMGVDVHDTYMRIGKMSVGQYIKSQMLLADKKKYFEMELKLEESK